MPSGSSIDDFGWTVRNMLKGDQEPGLFPEDLEEPPIDDAVKCCPDCERPNQFGELCPECLRGRGFGI